MASLRIYKPYKPGQMYGCTYPANPTKCAVEVNQGFGGWTKWGQCSRGAKYDAVIDGQSCKVCAQHRPEAVMARQEAADARYREQDRKWRREIYRPGEYMAALRKIAAGDNDARGTAREALEKWGDYNE